MELWQRTVKKNLYEAKVGITQKLLGALNGDVLCQFLS